MNERILFDFNVSDPILPGWRPLYCCRIQVSYFPLLIPQFWGLVLIWILLFNVIVQCALFACLVRENDFGDENKENEESLFFFIAWFWFGH